MRRELIQALLRRHAAAVLRVPEAALTPATTFRQAGLDSLTGLELRNERIVGEVGLPLSSAVLWRHPKVGALAEILTQQLGSDRPADAPPAQPVAAPLSAMDACGWFLVPRPSRARRACGSSASRSWAAWAQCFPAGSGTSPKRSSCRRCSCRGGHRATPKRRIPSIRSWSTRCAMRCCRASTRHTR